MNYDKNQKKALLFEAIGDLDDRILQDALVWRPRRLSLPRAWLIAATLSLSMIVTVSGFLLAMHRSGSSNVPPPSNENLPSSPSISLDASLLASRDTASCVTLSPDEISFYDGKARIVWQYANSDTLCASRVLTQQELAGLKKELGKGNRVGSDSPVLSCTVWIVCGNGEVLSPYLEPSAGTVGQGELFDYEVEVTPSDQLTSCIVNILK